MAKAKHSVNALDQAMAEALEAVEKHERHGDDASGTAEDVTTDVVSEAVSAEAPSNDEQITALKDQLLRLAADFDNYRKRTRKELDAAQRTGIDRLVFEILPALDNLTRALHHVEGDSGPLAEGVRMVARQFGEALRAHDVVAFESVGEIFDPQWHEAMSQVKTSEHAPGTVITEVTRGYRSGGRLLRPAQVVVAIAEAKPAATEDEADTSN